jgi:AraC-like DNA-binding protein
MCASNARFSLLAKRKSVLRRTTARQPRTFTHADRQRLDRAAEHYLRSCYRNKTAARVSEFATFLGVTSPYLSRVTRSIVGRPARDFLRAKQLVYAAQLLRATPLSVDEIALHCGFGTPWTFYRCFKSVYGMTPNAFREVMK